MEVEQGGKEIIKKKVILQIKNEEWRMIYKLLDIVFSCTAQLSWLDWCKELRPFYWRCPDECLVMSRDGRKNCVKDKLPLNSIE